MEREEQRAIDIESSDRKAEKLGLSVMFFCSLLIFTIGWLVVWTMRDKLGRNPFMTGAAGAVAAYTAKVVLDYVRYRRGRG